MYQRILITFAFLFIATFANAQDKGLYVGLQANGGFTQDPNYSYLPGSTSNKSHGELGFTGTFMVTHFMGIATGALYNKFNFDLHYEERPLGTQYLNYWRVPLGLRFIFSRKPRRVKVDFYGGLSFYFLQHADYIGGVAGPYGPTVPDHSTQHYRPVGLGGYTGMGMNIRIGKPCNLLLGFQIADAFGNQNKDASIQGYHMEASLFAFTFNLGFQICIFSYGREGAWPGR